jgi:DNA invertase Pin-like site-specific DNA recombinase
LSKGDTLVVSQLDRLARSTRNLLSILHEVSEHGAAFNRFKSWSIDNNKHALVFE